jgi:tetratricopeptide (TPR) repeat protein
MPNPQMPLISIPGEQAIATRKANPVAYWPERSGSNRLEPVTKPEFRSTFELEPGERIFTIGSCFAREIEGELLKRGFKVPVQEILKDPLFADIGTIVLNNYGTPSIYNELAWALGSDQPYIPKDHILEVQSGKFVDIHLHPTVPPANWDVCLSRRATLQYLMRQSLECRVIVITLGLAEVWYDSATHYYLNNIPRPALLRAYPDRFDLHVLSYEGAFHYFEKALLLLRSKGRKDQRVVLTVSPVPLLATHRPIDVIVANTYSKSVLRAVAETICAKYDWIDYYPSYESVMLSDRASAWDADQIHVTKDLVALNVARLLDRYIPGANDVENLADRIADGGRLVADELAIKAREKGRLYAKSFFDKYESWSDLSPAFAVEYSRFLVSEREHERAIEVLSKVTPDWEPMVVALLRAETLLHLGRTVDAINALLPVINDELRSQAIWELLVNAYAKNGEIDMAISTTHRYLAVMGYAMQRGFLTLARVFRDSDPARAADFYEAAVDDSCRGDEVEEFTDGNGWLQYEIIDFLTKHKRFGAARRLLTRVKPQNTDLEERFFILRKLLLAPTESLIQTDHTKQPPGKDL